MNSPAFSILGPYKHGDSSWEFEAFVIGEDAAGNKHVMARAMIRARDRDSIMQVAQAIHGVGNDLPPSILVPR